MRVLSVLTFLAGAAVLWIALGILGEAPLSAPESRHLRRIAVVAGHIAERVRIQGGSDSTLLEPGRPALARRRI